MNTTPHIQTPKSRLWPYLLIEIYFGIVATKSEVISWFRIQEMFRFQAFHMYGIIGSACGSTALCGRNFRIRAKEHYLKAPSSRL